MTGHMKYHFFVLTAMYWGLPGSQHGKFEPFLTPKKALFLRYTPIATSFCSRIKLTQWNHIVPISWGNFGHLWIIGRWPLGRLADRFLYPNDQSGPFWGLKCRFWAKNPIFEGTHWNCCYHHDWTIKIQRFVLTSVTGWTGLDPTWKAVLLEHLALPIKSSLHKGLFTYCVSQNQGVPRPPPPHQHWSAFGFLPPKRAQGGANKTSIYSENSVTTNFFQITCKKVLWLGLSPNLWGRRRGLKFPVPGKSS